MSDRDEQRDDATLVSEEDELEPAATDEETVRAVREAVERSQARDPKREERIESERSWEPEALEEQPDTDAEASEGDAVEQARPWR